MSLLDSGCYFEAVSEVGTSWDKVKRIKDWDEMLGVELFDQMYTLAPDEWGMFPYSQDDIETRPPKFVAFVKKFVRMLDQAVDMLGPDMEIVEDQLYELGTSHKRYGVTPKHFEMMGKAFVSVLKKTLGKRSFTPITEKSWKEIYNFMSMTMIQGAASV